MKITHLITALVTFFGCFSALMTSAQTTEEMLLEYDKLMKNEKYEKADELADILLEIHPDRAMFYVIKSETLGMIKEWNKSFEVLNYAISQFPDTIYLYVQTANLLVAFKDPDSAIPYFDKALEHCFTAKDSLDILTYRGGVHSRRREFETAEKDLKEALKIDSNSRDALNNLAAIYDEIGNTDKSIDILIQIVEIDSLYLPGIINLGFMLQNVEKHEKALVYFNKAVALAPNEPLAYSNRSFSKMKTGDLRGAMTDIDKSLELYPTNSWALKIKGLIYIERKKFDKACEQLYKARDMKYTDQYGSEVDDLIKGFCLD